jgi:hypothetical protein
VTCIYSTQCGLFSIEALLDHLRTILNHLRLYLDKCSVSIISLYASMNRLSLGSVSYTQMGSRCCTYIRRISCPRGSRGMESKDMTPLRNHIWLEGTRWLKEVEFREIDFVTNKLGSWDNTVVKNKSMREKQRNLTIHTIAHSFPVVNARPHLL